VSFFFFLFPFCLRLAFLHRCLSLFLDLLLFLCSLCCMSGCGGRHVKE
jgi:hypothetical protein